MASEPRYPSLRSLPRGGIGFGWVEVQARCSCGVACIPTTAGWSRMDVARPVLRMKIQWGMMMKTGVSSLTRSQSLRTDFTGPLITLSSMKRERNSLEGRLNDTCTEVLDDEVSRFSFVSISRLLLMCPARYQVDPRY